LSDYDVHIIGDKFDPIAWNVRDRLQKQGLHPLLCTRAEFVRNATIRSGPATVVPDRPLLIRHSRSPLPTSPDEDFIAQEQYAHFRGVASILKSVVINRPNPNSTDPTTSPLHAIAVLRQIAAPPQFSQFVVPSERLTFGIEPSPKGAEVQDLQTLKTSIVGRTSDDLTSMPLRIRTGRSDPFRYRFATVIGEKSIADRHGPQANAALDESLQQYAQWAASCLGLIFARIHFKVYSDDLVEVARVDPQPLVSARDAHLDECATALANALVG
jgi:hypothetical protein